MELTNIITPIITLTSLIVSFYTTDVVVRKFDENVITFFFDDWNKNITKLEIEHHKAKPGEVDKIEKGKFEIIAKDGKKKILNIIEGLSEKNSVVILVEVATVGVCITILDTLFSNK